MTISPSNLSRSRLGVLSANQGDQANHNGQHQQNMNKSAHGMPGKQTDQPQQQEHDKCSSQHGNSGFLLYSNGPKEKGILGYRRSAQTRDERKRILHPDGLVLHKRASTRGDRKISLRYRSLPEEWLRISSPLPCFLVRTNTRTIAGTF